MFSPKLWYHHFEKSPGFTKSWLMDMPIWKLNEHLEKGQGGLTPLPDGTATIQVNGQECCNG